MPAWRSCSATCPTSKRPGSCGHGTEQWALESRGLKLWEKQDRAQGRGGGAGQQQRLWGRELGQGAGAPHLSGVGVEAVDEVDMAPDGGKGGHLGTDQPPI